MEFDLFIENIDGKHIIILSVKSGKKTPYYVVENGSRTAYVRLGSGLKKILDYYETCENYYEDKKVIFESNPYDFRVVLPNLNFKVENVTDNVVENVTDIPDRKLSKTERLEEILKILSKNPETTVAELSVKLFVVQRTINRDIKKLQEDGRIERVGSDSKGYWKILK